MHKHIHSGFSVICSYNLCTRIFQHKLYDFTVNLIVFHQKNTHSGNITSQITLHIHRLRTPRPVNPNRQRNAHHAALAGLALYLNSSLHLICQLFHDGHAKTNAVIMRSCVLLLLGKRLKYVISEFLTHSDSRILNHKQKIRSPVLTANFFCLNKHGTVRAIVFNGIINDIHQDFPQVQRIPNQSAMLQVTLLQLKPNPPLLRLNRHNCNAVFQGFMNIKRLLHLNQSSCLKFTDLKNVVHQRQQVLR